VFEYKWKESFRSQWRRVLTAVIVGVLVGAIVSGVFRFLFLVDLPGRELVQGGWNPLDGGWNPLESLTRGGSVHA
jgi:hypothetical protein